MQEIANHIQQMDDEDLWNELGKRIQSEHDSTDDGETVLITLTISQGLFDHGVGLDRCISTGITWGVDQAEESKQKLEDVADAILEFPNDGVIYIDQIREELVRAIGDEPEAEPCRMPGCEQPRRDDGDAFGRKFCSDQCEVKFEHLKADAEDARRSEEEQQGPGRIIEGP